MRRCTYQLKLTVNRVCDAQMMKCRAAYTAVCGNEFRMAQYHTNTQTANNEHVVYSEDEFDNSYAMIQCVSTICNAQIHVRPVQIYTTPNKNSENRISEKINEKFESNRLFNGFGSLGCAVYFLVGFSYRKFNFREQWNVMVLEAAMT